ncbi:hypothetical protein WJX73_006812 [Symbiochloris irregularis]|uniref:Uncharacterized protein n=1 Tax=Symbiochloris irregularis TaxID=706552 RepID=A0AAW1PDG6_9CHLO
MAGSKERRPDKKRKSTAAAHSGGDPVTLANGHCATDGAPSVWPHSSFWPKRRRKQTISVALAASVIDVAQTLELATFLAGQIARTAAIFNIDEVVVIDDSEGSGVDSKVGESAAFLARVLQFMETPQYLRKALIPMHKSLRAAGLLAPLDAPHHVRATEWCPYREAVVLACSEGSGSVCDVGLSQHAVITDTVPEGQRITLELGEAATAASIPADLAKRANLGGATEGLQGRLVDPVQPRKRKGVYWGYTLRIAQGLHATLAQCPYEGGYDLKGRAAGPYAQRRHC